jgi:hypothetical protein
MGSGKREKENEKIFRKKETQGNTPHLLQTFIL